MYLVFDIRYMEEKLSQTKTNLLDWPQVNASFYALEITRLWLLAFRRSTNFHYISRILSLSVLTKVVSPMNYCKKIF